MHPTLPRHLLWATLLLAAPLAASAQASCSSDGQPASLAPTTLLERFINADCAACWSDAQPPQPGPGAVALDWIVPGTLGDEAPLSAAARQDSLDRQRALQHPASASLPQPARLQLRVALGPALGGYVGTSIALASTAPPVGPRSAWLALVETIPAGADGTAVERNLVRNTLVLDWSTAGPHTEIRPMAIPEGAQPTRLRVIGWVEDTHARVLGVAQSVCTADAN